MKSSGRDTFHMGAAAGNSMLEYGIIGAAVVVVAILGMSSLGSDFNQLLSDMKGEFSAKKETAALLSAKKSGFAQVNAPQTTGTGLKKASFGELTGGKVGLTLRDGSQIVIEAYPLDLRSSLQTSGANGTTVALASTLETLAQQLMEKGVISQAQGSSLMKLANQGHRLASIEAVAEDVSASCSTVSCFMDTPVTHDGLTYGSVISLVDQIGYKPNDGGNGRELQTLYDLRDQAVSSGALSDPAVKTLVLDLVERIAMTADAVESATGPVRNGEEPPSALIAEAASYTDKNAADICEAGGGNDSGIQCQ